MTPTFKEKEPYVAPCDESGVQRFWIIVTALILLEEIESLLDRAISDDGPDGTSRRSGVD